MPSPTATSTESETHHGRQPGRLRIFLRVGLALMLILVVLNLVAVQLARGALDRAEQRAVADGSSLDLGKLFPELEAPAENAHGYLEAAGKILDTLDEASRNAEGESLRRTIKDRLTELRPAGDPPTAADVELFRRGVEHYRLVLETLDTALPIERAYLDFDRRTLTWEGQYPDLLKRLQFSDLLAARARVATADGRADDAWRNVHAMFRLAGWCAEEMPTLLHQIIAAAVVRFGRQEAMALLRSDLAGPNDIQEHVLTEARRWDPQITFSSALYGDRASTVGSLLRDDARGWMDRHQLAPGVPRWLLSRPIRPWLHWNLAAYSNTATELFADCRKPAYLREPIIGRQGRMDALYPVPAWAPLARELVTENFFDACNKRDLTLANIDLMDIAFQVQRYRHDTGAYPPSLDALTGIPQLDPFSGEPYRYRLTETGAVVYSVGANRIDDGGVLPPADSGGQTLYLGDLVFRLGL